MDIFDLLDRLEEISLDNKTYCPEIYIQIGNTQVPLQNVNYFPETVDYCEAIVLSDSSDPKLMV